LGKEYDPSINYVYAYIIIHNMFWIIVEFKKSARSRVIGENVVAPPFILA